jgi:hypothetical protein
MSANPRPLPRFGKKPGQRQAPWRTDVVAARRAALRQGKPCVLILNVDSSAL